jgi:hypothetical protein
MGEWRYSSTHYYALHEIRVLVSFKSQSLSSRAKRPRYPLKRRLVGPWRLSTRSREDTGLCPSRQTKYDASDVQLVAYNDSHIPVSIG